MARFLHTADWHLGMKYARLGPNAQRAREARVHSAGRIMDLAREEGADFVIIAGDLFDSNEVDRSLVEVAVDLLRRVAPVPVYVLPGNHDPMTRDSLYLDKLWGSAENVVILDQEEPVRVPSVGVTLYPCPVKQRQTTQDPTRWIRTANEDISVGIAHGNLTIEGFMDEPNFPVDPQRAEKSGLDYLALGEWHSLRKFPGADGVERTAYPGTPEPTRFGEEGSGNVFIVEIERHGAPPVIHVRHVGVMSWEQWTRQVSTLEDVLLLNKELGQLPDPHQRAIMIRLEGVMDQETATSLASMESSVSERFLHVEIQREGLHLRPDLVKFRAKVPEGALLDRVILAIEALKRRHPMLQEDSQVSAQEAHMILREIGHLESARDASPEVLERALMLLYQMAEEVTR
jgi:DNA repair exonuclease SbcCD nuclease subunit